MVAFSSKNDKNIEINLSKRVKSIKIIDIILNVQIDYALIVYSFINK